MSCPQKDYTFVAGDTFNIQATLRDDTYTVIDTTGYVVTVFLRKDKSVQTPDFTFTATMVAEDGANGILSVKVSDAESAALITATQEQTSYNYRFLYSDLAGTQENIMNGVLEILQPITR